jgi:hypothetical protein
MEAVGNIIERVIRQIAKSFPVGIMEYSRGEVLRPTSTDALTYSLT